MGVRYAPGRIVSKSWWSSDLTIGVDYSQQAIEDVAELPHTHAEYAFIFCLDGPMDFVCSGSHYVLAPGELLVHNSGQVHQSRYGSEDAPSEALSLVITKSVVEAVMRRMRIFCRPDQRITFRGKTEDAGVARLAQDLIGEMEQMRAGYDIIVPSLVMQIIVHVFRYSLETVIEPQPSLPPQLPAWQMIKAMHYMSAHGKAEFNLAELCAGIGSSPSRFIPLFRNSTGVNPHVYFNQFLIRRACKMLCTGSHSVKEVAYELGFQNPGHFCRVFRSIAGATPKSFRSACSGDAGENLLWRQAAGN